MKFEQHKGRLWKKKMTLMPHFPLTVITMEELALHPASILKLYLQPNMHLVSNLILVPNVVAFVNIDSFVMVSLPFTLLLFKWISYKNFGFGPNSA